jgi:ribosomal protein L32
MEKKKKKYTIKQNRKIVKCPNCGKGKIEGEKCENCENIKYWKDITGE